MDERSPLASLEMRENLSVEVRLLAVDEKATEPVSTGVPRRHRMKPVSRNDQHVEIVRSVNRLRM